MTAPEVLDGVTEVSVRVGLPGGVGRVPVSGLLAAVDQPRATLVAIHGAQARAPYFHSQAQPGQSLLTLANRLGFDVVALDRPGYGASAGLVDEHDADQRAGIYRDALIQVLAGLPGVPRIVVSHSLGAAAAIRLVNGDLPGVAGWELCAYGHRQTPVKVVLKDSVPHDELSGLTMRELVWGPKDLYPPGRRDTGERRSTWLRSEATDTADWHAELSARAAVVPVPVRLTMGERDQLWEHSPAAMTELAAMFTAAPRVTTHEQAGAPHNMSLARTARAYHLGVLAFAEDCLLSAPTS